LTMLACSVIRHNVFACAQLVTSLLFFCCTMFWVVHNVFAIGTRSSLYPSSVFVPPNYSCRLYLPFPPKTSVRVDSVWYSAY
jgi:hypothetical protein